MKQLKHCLPLIEQQLSEVAEKISQHKEYDFFEIWLDYLQDLSISSLQELTKQYPGKLILLNRRLALEPIKRSFEDRIETIQTLSTAPCLFDFDIKIQLDELEHLASSGCAIQKIISYHNYKRTPDTSELEKILAEMDKFDPAISKLACYCENAADGVRLLELVSKISQQQRVIIIGMGHYGLPTRVFGCQYGNEFCFSPISRKAESAPGQLTRSELESIVEVLNRAR